MTSRRPHIGWMRALLVAGAAVSGGVFAAVPAQAQGPDDFLNDVNGIGIGNRNDKRNFDLVGLGNVICWRLYGGESRSQIAEMLLTSSGSATQAALTHDQADATVGFAIADLCPDATPQ